MLLLLLLLLNFQTIHVENIRYFRNKNAKSLMFSFHWIWTISSGNVIYIWGIKRNLFHQFKFRIHDTLIKVESLLSLLICSLRKFREYDGIWVHFICILEKFHSMRTRFSTIFSHKTAHGSLSIEILCNSTAFYKKKCVHDVCCSFWHLTTKISLNITTKLAGVHKIVNQKKKFI